MLIQPEILIGASVPPPRLHWSTRLKRWLVGAMIARPKPRGDGLDPAAGIVLSLVSQEKSEVSDLARLRQRTEAAANVLSRRSPALEVLALQLRGDGRSVGARL